VESIPYKDVLREKQRLANLEKKQEEEEEEEEGKNARKGHKKPAAAWSQNKEMKEKRLIRGEKREKRRVAKSLVKLDQGQERGDVPTLDWKRKCIEEKSLVVVSQGMKKLKS
jgi:hypothetical protein